MRPRVLPRAAVSVEAYPLHQNTRQAKALWRDLLRIHAPELPAEFQMARAYF